MKSKTTWTGALAGLTATLTLLAALPYDLGQIAEIIPSQWKPYVTGVGIIATLGLRILNAFQQQDQIMVIEEDGTKKPISPVASAPED